MAHRLLLPALLLSITCPAAWAQDPAGAEFRVNSYTTSNQLGPAVASAADGSFVVVWQSFPQDGSIFGVFGQRFSASGLPQGSEFQVNSYTTSFQHNPAVASDANGNFVVVWSSYPQDGSDWGVFGRRFNASGLPQGSEFQVNSHTTSLQYYPAVASDANGNFVVVWESFGQDGYISMGVFGQRFNASGVPQSSEFRVNTYVAGHQRSPAVASDASGNFVVVWQSNFQDGSGYGIFAQHYDPAGLAQGSEFQVNTYAAGTQRFPAVASDANGNFVAVWNSFGQDGSFYGVLGQRFNAAGLRQGSEFQANAYVTGSQHRPVVGSDANGNFVIIWHSSYQDGGGYGVFGQRFNADGLPQGPEFQANSYTTSFQGSPAVASAANGNFVAVWTSYDQDGSDRGIFGQRYGDVLFRDGFE